MKNKLFFTVIGTVVMVALSTAEGFSQVAIAQNRIPQQIVINGQVANGAFVTTAGGQLQSYTCPDPQPYTTADGSSQGWACYEGTTGVWLLNALPPAQAAAPIPQQPTVIYQQAPPVVYQQAPTVIYQAAPAVIYRRPAPVVVYTVRPRPVVVAPVYPPSIVFGTAAINAAGRIASAAIASSHYHPPERRHERESWHGHRS